MKITIVIPGSIRSKKNSKRIFAVGRFKKVLPSKAYVEWEAQARGFLYMRPDIWPVQPAIEGPVHITALCYCKGVLPDLSGALESVGDAFQGILWENDRQICSWDGSRVFRDTKNPRVELSMEW